LSAVREASRRSPSSLVSSARRSLRIAPFATSRPCGSAWHEGELRCGIHPSLARAPGCVHLHVSHCCCAAPPRWPPRSRPNPLRSRATPR
jgi:hypothetical protein